MSSLVNRIHCMGRVLPLALGLLFSFPVRSDVPAKLDQKEYNSELQKMAAACAARNMPHLNGLCLSQKPDGAARTAITVALEMHRFELYLKRCEHSAAPDGKALQNQVFKIADVRMFYEEMALQREALDFYSRNANNCKTNADNDVEVTRRLQWFGYMVGKYSEEAKEQAAAVQREKRRQQSLIEMPLRETDPWFVGRFSAPFPVDGGTGNWSLKCVLGEECVLTIHKPNTAPQTVPMRVPIRREIVIPNNNLQLTRDRVRERPELYEDKREGPMLMELRDLLASEARFERCVNIAADGDIAVCSLTTDPRAAKSLVLLLGTMKGSCGNSPFCAYYYQMLGREKGE